MQWPGDRLTGKRCEMHVGKKERRRPGGERGAAQVMVGGSTERRAASSSGLVTVLTSGQQQQGTCPVCSTTTQATNAKLPPCLTLPNPNPGSTQPTLCPQRASRKQMLPILSCQTGLGSGTATSRRHPRTQCWRTSFQPADSSRTTCKHKGRCQAVPPDGLTPRPIRP